MFKLDLILCSEGLSAKTDIKPHENGCFVCNAGSSSSGFRLEITATPCGSKDSAGEKIHQQFQLSGNAGKQPGPGGGIPEQGLPLVARESLPFFDLASCRAVLPGLRALQNHAATVQDLALWERASTALAAVERAEKLAAEAEA